MDNAKDFFGIYFPSTAEGDMTDTTTTQANEIIVYSPSQGADITVPKSEILMVSNPEKCDKKESEKGHAPTGEYQRFHRLIHAIFNLCELADFRLEGRIRLVDKKTGKVYK